MVEAQLVLANSTTVKITRETFSEHPNVMRSGTGTTTDATSEYREETEYSRVNFNCRFTDDDFRLTGFGLPEPPQFQRRGWLSLGWYLALLAVPIIIIGLWLIRRNAS